MKSAFLAALVLGTAVGCGGGEAYEFAPVSGTVTLDGDPLTNATVIFQPTGAGPTPGPDSYGKTDAQGKFSLKPVNMEGTGAVVGKHQVRITRDLEEDPNDDAGGPQEDQLPEKYNRKTTLELDVPSEGTDSADFELET